MQAAAVRPTIVKAMASAPATNRTIYAAAETRSDVELLPGTLLFGPQFRRKQNGRKRKRDELRGSFPLVLPWGNVSSEVGGVQDVDFAPSGANLLEDAVRGAPFSDRQIDDRYHSVPTQSKARVFGVWNAEHETNPSSAVSVAISGVVNVVVETVSTEPIIGLRVGFTREQGIPSPYVALPPDAECIGTIIGPSKPLSNNDQYFKIGYKQPVMAPMLLHVRDAPPRAKPSETLRRFSENVLNIVGMATEANTAAFAAQITRPHLVLSKSESEITTPKSASPEYKTWANEIVKSIVTGALANIKDPAENLLDSYIHSRESDLDEFPWDKLSRLPLGWETPDIIDVSAFRDGDYVCMGLIALRVWLTRDAVL